MRPWRVWIGFALCLAVLLAAMGWATATVVRLDRAQADARRRAAVEETLRLALWRMESALTPLLAQESSHPYFAYAAFYPAERAYPRMFMTTGKGETLMPSPLLLQTQPRVLLNFQIDALGHCSSPQVPVGSMRTLAINNHYKDLPAIAAAERRLAALKQAATFQQLHARLPAPLPSPAEVAVIPPQTPPPPPTSPYAQQFGKIQQKEIGLDQRSRAHQQTVMQQQAIASNVLNQPPAGKGVASQGSADEGPAGRSVAAGLMQPVWLGEMLLVARRITVNGQDYIQGSWLDWPAIRDWLTGEIRDLLPAATLEPAADSAADHNSPRLAALPVQLVSGPMAASAGDSASSLQFSLWLAWAGVAAAALAVGALLRGAVALSERRAAFVSAVTHELRTPLTTFRLYTDLLEQGRVAGEDRRKSYLATLRSQAERLCHLVDNVLAYARLERNRHRPSPETLDLNDFFTQVLPRLGERIQQAGMSVQIKTIGPASSTSSSPPLCVRANRCTLEQILLNLIDNACKYAGSAENRTIDITAGVSGRRAAIRIRDYGPGIAPADRKTLFKPFNKSARRAAESAPGVGLGLSLSRRLARDMGGDLTLDEHISPGACFVLTLRTT